MLLPHVGEQARHPANAVARLLIDLERRLRTQKRAGRESARRHIAIAHPLVGRGLAGPPQPMAHRLARRRLGLRTQRAGRQGGDAVELRQRRVVQHQVEHEIDCARLALLLVHRHMGGRR